MNFSLDIPMRSGVDLYNVSWTVPGDSFSVRDSARVTIGHGNFDVYLLDAYSSKRIILCSLTQPTNIDDTSDEGECQRNIPIVRGFQLGMNTAKASEPVSTASESRTTACDLGGPLWIIRRALKPSVTRAAMPVPASTASAMIT